MSTPPWLKKVLNRWRASPGGSAEGWEQPGFDDSDWPQATLPAPDNCGWSMTAEALNRPFEPWEHAGVPTMWSPQPDDVVHLRRSFDLPANAVVTSAMMTTVSDDDHDLYVNGFLVASDQDGLGGPVVTTDIGEYLVAGHNVVAVVITNIQCCCRWFAANGTIEW